MQVWLLIVWGLYVDAFIAGGYRTFEECEAAGIVQQVGLRGVYGPGKLNWVCRREDIAHIGMLKED